MSLGLLKTIWARVKWSVLILAAVAVLLGAAGMFLLGRGCGDRPRPAEPVSTATGAPPGWVAPAEETTPWLPFKKNRASEVTAGFPAGSRVVEVEVPEGAQKVRIGILPDGEVVVPPGVTAVVYEKRPPIINAEVRPWLGGGAEGTPVDVDPAIAAGVDLVRVWHIHAGPGLVASTDNIAGVLSGAVSVWRNVDVRGGGGYGTAGAVGFAGVSIGIE